MGFCCKCKKWIDLTGGYFSPKEGFTCSNCRDIEEENEK